MKKVTIPLHPFDPGVNYRSRELVRVLHCNEQFVLAGFDSAPRRRQ